MNGKRDYQTNGLVYHPPLNKSLHGDVFGEVNKTFLLNLLPDPVSINRSNINDVMFVTAISQAYYSRLTPLVETFQVYFPAAKLVVYNLGVSKNQLKSVSILIIGTVPKNCMSLCLFASKETTSNIVCHELPMKQSHFRILIFKVTDSDMDDIFPCINACILLKYFG